MIRKIFAIGVFSTVLSACSQPNPLIGTWKLKSEQRTAAAIVFPCEEVVFEKSMVFCGSMVTKVTYEVRKKYVVVHGREKSTMYKLLDRNTISFEIPRMGEVQLNRANLEPK